MISRKELHQCIAERDVSPILGKPNEYGIEISLPENASDEMRARVVRALQVFCDALSWPEVAEAALAAGPAEDTHFPPNNDGLQSNIHSGNNWDEVDHSIRTRRRIASLRIGQVVGNKAALDRIGMPDVEIAKLQTISPSHVE